ncbi:hypothetical protein CBJ49_004709 [Salmonella enterica subsp. enterica serovar Coleypark]|nr:hypothetical protein [Salmonella enterica subsp. enterica serovar Coleypark]
MVCVVGRIRDLILQLSKSSIYSTKPYTRPNFDALWESTSDFQQNSRSAIIC